MTASTLMAPTSSHCALVAAILAASKVFRACQNLAQARIGDLVKGHAGETHDPLHSIKEPMDLVLDGWQDLPWPRLKIPALKLASGAALVTDDLDTFPELHIPNLVHSAIRKEGV